jgi:hypothetical protein
MPNSTGRGGFQTGRSGNPAVIAARRSSDFACCCRATLRARSKYSSALAAAAGRALSGDAGVSIGGVAGRCAGQEARAEGVAGEISRIEPNTDGVSLRDLGDAAIAEPCAP